VQDSPSLVFTTRSQLLKNFVNSRAPVFCFADKTIALPLSVKDFLSNSKLLPPNVPAITADLSTGTSLVYGGPASDGGDATVYLTVQDATGDPLYVNYTDFNYYLLYTTGWVRVSLRYNNETMNLEAAWFPSLGWIYNLDSNYSTCLSSDANPLQLLLRPDGSIRLHVLVGSQGPVPTFPQQTTNGTNGPVPLSKVDQIKYITTNSNWAMVVDGSKMEIVQADMIADDDTGAGIAVPAWAKWGGTWANNTFE
jgi:hypothetical protein